MPPDAPDNEITYSKEQLAEAEEREKRAAKVNKKLLAKQQQGEIEPEPEAKKTSRQSRSTD